MPGADHQVGGPTPASSAEPNTWPDEISRPPGADGHASPGPGVGGNGPPRPSARGYSPPQAGPAPARYTPPPQQPEPRLRFDSPPVTGQWQRPESQPQPGSWQPGDRPSYGPAQPYDQTRPRPQAWPGDQAGPYEPRPPFEPNRDPRPPWEQSSYADPWPQAQPERGYETRAPFEPLTRHDPGQTGPQPRYSGPPFTPPQSARQPPAGQPPTGQPPTGLAPGQPALGGLPFAAQPPPGQPAAAASTIAAPQQPAPAQVLPGQTQRPPKRRRRRLIVIVAVVVVLLLGAGAAGGSYLLLRTQGSPAQTAASYLAAWQRLDYQAMGRVSLDVPRGGLAGPIKRAKAQLGVKHTKLTLGSVTTSGNTAKASFSVTDYLASNHVWTYHGELSLMVAKRHWWVKWSPSAIYPGLAPGERFGLTAIWPPRAQILADDGTVLSSQATIAESGSLALLTGYLGPATAAQAKALGAPYRKGDVIGQSGIELTYQSQLAGRPSLTIKIVGPGKRLDATAMRFAAKLGTPVRTSVNMAAQFAASRAVSSAKTSKPVDLVAMQASTGRVLAVVERPGGYDRALQGIFPPGSTFKVVTASALAKTGLTPASTVQCPSKVDIGGRVFHNDKNEHLGTTDLQTAFAVSCNSTFALLATQRLNGPSLASEARVFGFNARPELGLPGAELGHFSTPRDPVDLAADAFGQGLDLVNPLSQASEVAAIDSGVWRPPLLVVSPRPHQKVKPHVISATILNTLRPMMRAVVTSGTAAGVGFPPGVYGKTGTAEYGTGPHPKAHGWFIGYQGDIAFAVLVEGGGYGADSAGPIAKAFLHDLGG
jgi:hypothetical protein